MTTYWLCAAFTLISACVSLGYSVASVVGPNAGAAREAEYALARSIALVAVAVVPLFGERHDWLVAVAVAMVMVQALDAVVGARIPDRLKTFGPAGTAAVNLALLLWYVAN